MVLNMHGFHLKSSILRRANLMVIKRSFFGNNQSKSANPTQNIVALGNVSAERPVPDHIQRPDYATDGLPSHSSHPTTATTQPEIKSADDILRMRDSCRLAATILKKCRSIVQPGLTTDEIDRFVHSEIIAANAYPSPLRYNGFPKSVCTSVNNVACHGIPDDRALCDGDILNIDVTVFLNGFHGDCSDMYSVGTIDPRSQFLIDVTNKCLYNAIAKCAPGVEFNVIGNEIDRTARSNRLLVIPAFIGHGIGRFFHGPPEILHYNNCEGGAMRSGMVFTIEPVISLGTEEVEIQEDGWTAFSVDGSRNAQVEHTILITDDGHEILTKCDE